MKKAMIGMLLCSLAVITGCTATSPERSNVAGEGELPASEPMIIAHNHQQA